MLVLTRFKDQGVWIVVGEHKMRISLIDAHERGKAKLGFDGPEIFEVYRDEVYERVLKEGERGLAQGNPRTGERDPGVLPPSQRDTDVSPTEEHSRDTPDQHMHRAKAMDGRSQAG